MPLDDLPPVPPGDPPLEPPSMLDEPVRAAPPEEEKAKFGGFMPAALRVKRQAHQSAQQQKAKMRRSASAEDLNTAEPKEPATTAAPAEPVSRIEPNPLRAPMQHTIPSRECRSADELYNNLKAVQEGRHGVVYKAKDKYTGEVVALKNMKNTKDGTPGGFSMVFMREVNVLFEIQHPNIVTLREVVHVSQADDDECEDANWFLVMEFVDHDLKDVITTMKTPFTAAQACAAVSCCAPDWFVPGKAFDVRVGCCSCRPARGMGGSS